MPITAHQSLQHMAWANARIFTAIQALPESVLTVYIANPEWTVAKLLQHIVDGAEWYQYCLTGRHDGWNKVLPTTMADVAILQAQLASYDAAILAQADLDDELLSVTMDDGSTMPVLRSILIAQSPHHATEHRAQLADALEAHAIAGIDLDRNDLWAFTTTLS